MQLTFDPASDNTPAWSPDGTEIAFGSDRGGNVDIWVMSATGQDLTRLTVDPATDYAPAWSPDGRAIAFISSRTGRTELWAIAASGE